MIITIDLETDRPIYKQIAAGVRRAIAGGDIEPGGRLPPGRELSDALGVNLETVQRAYRDLAAEGLVVSRVGRGTRVSDTIDVGRLSIAERIDALLEESARLGLTTDDVVAIIRGRS